MKKAMFRVQYYDDDKKLKEHFWEDDELFRSLETAKMYARTETIGTRITHRVVKETKEVVETFYKTNNKEGK